MKQILLITLGAFLLCFMAFNNKFPLLSENSGEYIDAGFAHSVRSTKSLYGHFITHSSWGNSLWLVIYSQAMMLSAVLFYFFKYFGNKFNYQTYYLACLIFITFCTSGSVVTSLIDNYVFVSTSILCTAILLFSTAISRPDLLVIGFINAVSLLMATSLIVTLVLIVAFYFLLLLIRKIKTKSENIVDTHYRVKNLGAILIFVLIINFAFITHYVDVLEHYNILTLNLNKVHSKLTALESLNTRKLCSDICTFLDNKFNIELPRLKENSETILALYKWYNSDLRECIISRQYQGWLDLKFLNYSQIVFLFLSTITWFFFLFKKKYKKITVITGFIIFTLLLYAFVNIAIINKSPNLYQLSWLISIPIFLACSDAPQHKRHQDKL